VLLVFVVDAAAGAVLVVAAVVAAVVPEGNQSIISTWGNTVIL